MQGQGGPMWGSTKQGRAFPSGDPKPCPCLQTRRRGAALPKAPGAAALEPGPTPSAARYRRARYLLDFGWSLGWWSGVFWLPDKVLMKNSLRDTRRSAMNISGFVQNNREGVRGRMHRRGEEGARQQLPSRCSVRPRFVETGSEEGPHSTVLRDPSPSSLPGARTISIKGREMDRGPGLSHRMAAGTSSAQPQSPPGAAPCSYVAIGIRQETILPPPVSPRPKKTENEPLSLWSVIQSHGAAPTPLWDGDPKTRQPVSFPANRPRGCKVHSHSIWGTWSSAPLQLLPGWRWDSAGWGTKPHHLCSPQNRSTAPSWSSTSPGHAGPAGKGF